MRVDPCQVRSLMQIASVACQGGIFEIVGAAMLPGDDMFNVMLQLAILLV